MDAQDERDGIGWIIGACPPSENDPIHKKFAPFRRLVALEAPLLPASTGTLLPSLSIYLVHPVHPCKFSVPAELGAHETKPLLRCGPTVDIMPRGQYQRFTRMGHF